MMTRSNALRTFRSAINKFNFDNFRYFFYVTYDCFFHVYVIILFEIIFYIEYVVKIERGQIIELLNEFGKYLKDELVRYEQRFSVPVAYGLMDVYPLCHHLDKYQTIDNSVVILNAYKIIYILSIMCASLTVIFICVFGLRNYGKLIIQTSVFASCLILFEYIFFFEIIQKYKVITNEEALCNVLVNVN